jgi:tetratricopeptide (TPR) repeat protein
VCIPLGLAYVQYAESQKESGMYKAAINSYLKSMNFKPDPNLYMIIANLYDNKLNDPDRAIRYYQKFLDNLKNSKTHFTSEYIYTVKQRLEYLKAFR